MRFVLRNDALGHHALDFRHRETAADEAFGGPRRQGQGGRAKLFVHALLLPQVAGFEIAPRLPVGLDPRDDACQRACSGGMQEMHEDLQYAVLHEFVAPAQAQAVARNLGLPDGRRRDGDDPGAQPVALDSLAFRPRVLRNVEKVDTGGKVLGQKLRLPVILAPIGSLQDIVAGGGEAPTRAAAKFGALHMLSSACAPGPGGGGRLQRAPQDLPALRARRHRPGWTTTSPAPIASGYIALCLTVDLDYYGRRERDLAKRYLTTSRRTRPADHFQARFSWADVARLKAKFKIPFILKGIATAEDARIALEHGIEAIYVSNHGGRQLDHGKGGIAVLPEVVEAAAGRAEIYRRWRLPARHRHRQGDGARRQRGRPRPPAGPGAGGRRRGGSGARARASAGRGEALPRPGRRRLVRRAEPELRHRCRAASPAPGSTAPSRCSGRAIEDAPRLDRRLPRWRRKSAGSNSPMGSSDDTHACCTRAWLGPGTLAYKWPPGLADDPPRPFPRSPAAALRRRRRGLGLRRRGGGVAAGARRQARGRAGAGARVPHRRVPASLPGAAGADAGHGQARAPGARRRGSTMCGWARTCMSWSAAAWAAAR